MPPIRLDVFDEKLSELNVTPSGLALSIGCAPNTILGWYEGKEPRYATLNKLRRAGIDPDELIDHSKVSQRREAKLSALKSEEPSAKLWVAEHPLEFDENDALDRLLQNAMEFIGKPQVISVEGDRGTVEITVAMDSEQAGVMAKAFLAKHLVELRIVQIEVPRSAVPGQRGGFVGGAVGTAAGSLGPGSVIGGFFGSVVPGFGTIVGAAVGAAIGHVVGELVRERISGVAIQYGDKVARLRYNFS